MERVSWPKTQPQQERAATRLQPEQLPARLQEFPCKARAQPRSQGSVVAGQPHVSLQCHRPRSSATASHSPLQTASPAAPDAIRGLQVSQFRCDASGFSRQNTGPGFTAICELAEDSTSGQLQWFTLMIFALHMPTFVALSAM